MGPTRRPSHARLRGPGRVLRAADGQEPGAGAAADRLGHGRADHRARRRRPSRRAASGRPRCDRRATSSPTGAGSATSPTSPTTAAAGSSGAPRAATPRPCRSSSTLLGERRQLDPGGLDRHVRRLREGRSAPRCPTRRSRLTRSTWSRSPGAPSTTCAAPSGTPRASRARPRASGSRTCAGRCARRPRTSPTASASRSPRSSRPTRSSTAPTCSRNSSARSTTSTTPPTPTRTSTPGWPGPHAPSCEPFVRLARTLRRYRDGILAAVRLGLTNARLEGLHSKVRLLRHRSFGFHSAAPLIALIYLCCTGITIPPPLR